MHEVKQSFLSFTEFNLECTLQLLPLKNQQLNECSIESMLKMHDFKCLTNVFQSGLKVD